MFLLDKLRSLRDKLFFPLARQLGKMEERLGKMEERLEQAQTQIERIQEALGRVEGRQLKGCDSPYLSDHEYRVYSQWGEDGIIQFLLSQVGVRRKVFVEFGVEDYREANTRFLLTRDNWTGLVLDASGENIYRLRGSEICWRYGLRAVQSFITRDNINRLMVENEISGEIGLLSIDIDGNDYWIWEAVEVVDPEIVVIEYNHRFGSDLAVTIPYDENFRRGEKYPVIYFGASLRALCLLARRKGYAFVGCNSNGVNAFFVRRDRLPDGLMELSPSDGFVLGKFTEHRDERGLFVPALPEEEYRRLLSLPLVDVAESAETAA